MLNLSDLPVRALLALLVTLVVLALATTLRHWLRLVGEARSARCEAQIRPHLLKLLCADAPNLSALVAPGGATGRAVERLAAQLLPKLRGADRMVLAGLLDARGVIDRARHRSRGWGAVGRARAAKLLGDAGEPRAHPELVALLDDRNPLVRAMAVRALGKLGDASAVPDLLGSIWATRTVPISIVAMALLHVGPSVVEPLRDGLGSRSPEVRAVAAEILGLEGDLGARHVLLALLVEDPDLEVRVHAARALGRIGAPDAVAPLVRCLRSPVADPLRAEAARALGRIGASDALPALKAALGMCTHEVATQAAAALGTMGAAGTTVLEQVAAASQQGTPYAREVLAVAAVRSSSQRP